MSEQSQDAAVSKLPHQSIPVQISTAQSAVMFLLHNYFPGIDTNIFLAWGCIFTFILSIVPADKISWYRRKSEKS